MKIAVINPNSSESMTESIKAAAQLCVSETVSLKVMRNPEGPLSIEGYSDGVQAACSLIPLVQELEAGGTEGYVIACFDDTGVESVRELTAGPVLGIGEAAMHAASIISARYSIVTSLERSIPILEDNGRKYGLLAKCRGVHAFNLPVLSFEEQNPASDYAQLKEVAWKIVTNDRSDALVLGCGGMTHLQQKLSEDLGIPVIDGVKVAVKTIEGLLSLGLRTSKAGAYGFPCSKAH